MNAKKAIQSLAITAALSVAAFGVQSGNTQQSTSGGRYDQQIQQSVDKTLHDHDSFKNVNAKVEDGTISLTGTVPTLADKLSLDHKMHDKDHVDAVRNQVQVKDASVSDADLRAKLADKLRYDRIDRGIQYNSINLGVQNGVVTLTGSVLDDVSHDSALSIVEHTPGVKQIIDNIQVQPTSIADDELRIRLARAIYGDPAMTQLAMDPQAPIRIVVSNGHVTLAGVVDTQMQKTIAYTRASSVPGVFSVKNNLIVASQQPR